jgi:predicted transcriptional regulator
MNLFNPSLIMETWKTKEGKEILIRDMDDRHLINAIRMLERRAEEGVRRIYGSPMCMSSAEDMEGCGVEIISGKDYLDGTPYEEMKKELESRSIPNEPF